MKNRYPRRSELNIDQGRSPSIPKNVYKSPRNQAVIDANKGKSCPEG